MSRIRSSSTSSAPIDRHRRRERSAPVCPNDPDPRWRHDSGAGGTSEPARREMPAGARPPRATRGHRELLPPAAPGESRRHTEDSAGVPCPAHPYWSGWPAPMEKSPHSPALGARGPTTEVGQPRRVRCAEGWTGRQPGNNPGAGPILQSDGAAALRARAAGSELHWWSAPRDERDLARERKERHRAGPGSHGLPSGALSGETAADSMVGGQPLV